MRKQGCGQPMVNLKVKLNDIDYDPKTNTWIGASAKGLALITQGRDGTTKTEDKTLLRISENAVASHIVANEMPNRERIYGRFVPNESVNLDVTGLTARVTKADSIYTTIELGTSSLAFDIIDSCIGNPVRFFVENRADSETTTDTSIEFKSDTSIVYSLVWDSDKKALSIFVKGIKKNTINVKSGSGVFGIKPSGPGTYTLNPFRTIFPTISSKSAGRYISLSNAKKESDEDLSKKVATYFAESTDIQLIYKSEDGSALIYWVDRLPKDENLLTTELKEHHALVFYDLEDFRKHKELPTEVTAAVEAIFKQVTSSQEALLQGGETQDAHKMEEDTSNRKVNYINSSDSLLFSTDDSIKLLKRNRGYFRLSENSFESAVFTQDQITAIQLTAADATVLSQSIKSQDLKLTLIGPGKGLKTFVDSISALLNDGNKPIIIKDSFGRLVQSLNYLASALVGFLNVNKTIGALEGKSGEPTMNVSTQDSEGRDEDYSVGRLFDDEDANLAAEEKKSESPEGAKCYDEQKSKHFYSLRIVLDLLEQLRARSIYIKDSPNQSGNIGAGYSAYQRLTSFCSAKSIGRSYVDLSSGGVVNTVNGLINLNYFLYEDKPLSGLDAADTTNSSIFEVLAQNGIDFRENIHMLNIPLSSYVNALPPINFSSNILNTDLEQVDGCLAVQLENQDLILYDTTVGLVQLYRGNMRDNSHKQRMRSSIVEKKHKMFFNLDPSINQKVFEAIAEHKKPLTAEENPNNIIPDPVKLEQIYKMGFSIEMGKRALIKTKNQSVEAALEAILTLQGDEIEDEDTEVLKQAVSLIKPEWNCQFCTFLNNTSEMDAKDICMMCGNPAPLDAYYSKTEIDQMQEVQAQIEIAQKENEMFLEEENKKNKEAAADEQGVQGKATNVKISSLSTNYLSRYLIAVGFNDESTNKSALRVRRVGYSGAYTKSLMREDIEGSFNVANLSIGGVVYQESENLNFEKIIGDHLKEGARVQIDSLIPSSSYKENPMEAIDQADIELEGQILDIYFSSTSSIERRADQQQAEGEKKKEAEQIDYEIKVLFALILSEGKVKVQKLELACKVHDFFNPVTQLSKLAEITLSDAPSQDQFLPSDNSAQIRVFSNQSVHILNLNDLTSVSTQKIEQQIQKLKFTYDGVWGFDSESNSYQISANEVEVQKKVKEGESNASEETGAVSCEEILKFMHHKRYMAYSVTNYSQNPILRMDNPVDNFTFHSKMMVADPEKNIRFSITPKEDSVMNGVLHMNFGFVSKDPSKEVKNEPTTSKSGAVSAPVIDKGDEDKIIPLRVAHQSFDGTNQSSILGSAVFGGGQNQIFTGKKSDLNYAFFENQYELNMLINQITLVSKATGTDDHVESALVFTSNSTGMAHKIDVRHLGKPGEYKSWITAKLKANEKIEEWEPVGFLNLSDSKATVSLDHVRQSRYLCLVFKITNKKNTFRIHQILAKGSCESGEDTTGAELPKPTREDAESGVTLTITNQGNPICTSKKVMIESNGKTSLSSVVNLNYYEELKEVTFEISSSSESRFTLENVSLQLIKCGSSSEKGLKEIFENKTKFAELMKNQAAKLALPNVSIEEKRKIASLLSDVLTTIDSSLLPELQGAIDIDHLVRNTILKCDDQELISKLTILCEKYSENESFSSKLQASLTNTIENIETFETNLESLKNFFKLVSNLRQLPSYASLPDSIRGLLAKAILKLQDTNSQDNRILSQIGVKQDPFDQSVFWSRNSSSKKSGAQDAFTDYFSVDYTVVKSLTQIELYCDLKRSVSLNRLLIKFSNMAHHTSDVYPYLSVFKVEPQDNNNWNFSKEELIFSRELNASFLYFTNKTAREASLNFYQGKEWFNAIGFRMGNVTGRYFKVRLTFDTSKFTKALYKINKHKIEPYFFGYSEADAEAKEKNLPNFKLNTKAKISNGEVVVTTQSIVNSKQTSSTGGSEEKDTKIATPELEQNIASGSELLRETIAQLRGKQTSSEESAHVKEIADALIKMKESKTVDQKNCSGDNSFSFWIYIIELVNTTGIDKLGTQLNFNHFKSIFENILEMDLSQNIQEICLDLIKDCLSREGAANSFKILKSLLKFISTGEKVQVVQNKELIKVIHKLCARNKDIPIFDLVHYTLSKLCKNYESDPELSLIQMNWIIDLLFFFTVPATKEGEDDETYVVAVLYDILNIVLWLFEQDSIPPNDKVLLSEKAIKLFNQVFVQNKAKLTKVLKIDRNVFEVLLIRSYALGAFENLEPVIENLMNLSTSTEGLVDIAKDLLNIHSDVLTQLLQYMKDDQKEESDTVSAILKGHKPEERVTMNFLGFLIKSCDKLARIVKSTKKKEEAKPEEEKSPIRKRKTLSAEELTAQRSLSIPSQNMESQESDLLPTQTVKDLLSLYKERYIQGNSNPLLFTEVSKLVCAKISQRDNLRLFLELYREHSVEEKSLITNTLLNIIVEHFENLQKLVPAGQENKALKEYCSCLLDGFTELVNTHGLDKLDQEFINLLINVQEMVIGPESKKGLNANPKSLVSCLSIYCVSHMFYVTMKEMNRLCSWGGPDGWDSLEKKRVPYSEVIYYFLMIINAASSSTKTATLQDMVANLKSINMTKVNEAVYQLLEWNVLNNMHTTKKSPTMDRLLKICSYVDHILKVLADNPEACKVLIKKMFELVTNLHPRLVSMVSDGKLPFAGINIVYNLFATMEKVLELTLNDPHIVSYFTGETKGIHAVFDLLNISYASSTVDTTTTTSSGQKVLSFLSGVRESKTATMDEKSQPASAIKSKAEAANLTPVSSKLEVPSNTMVLQTPPVTKLPKMTQESISMATPVSVVKGIITSPQPASVTATTSTDKAAQTPLTAQNYKNYVPCLNPDKFSDEFAKDLKCLTKINQKDEKLTDWQKNKKAGAKQLFLYPIINDHTRNNREAELEFQLSAPIDIRAIKAGFLSQYNDYGNKAVAEPSYIRIHYKCKETDSWMYLCTLLRYDDNGYCLGATVCYQKNFMRYEGETLNSKLDSVIFPRNVQYLKFLMGRPNISYQENYSNLKGKDMNQIVLAPSFFSILGVNGKQYSMQVINNYIKETSLLKLIHKIFAKDQKSLEIVSLQPDLTEKFKNIFERLMDEHIEMFTTPLISFSRNNQEFGVWVIKRMLDLKLKDEHARVVGEIIMSTPEQYQLRVGLLCNFIMKEISKDLSGKGQHSERLYSFMTVFSYCINRGPKDQPPQALEIDIPDIELLIAFFAKIPYVQQFKSFFISLVYLPNPSFKLKAENTLDYLMNSLSIRVKDDNEYVLAELLSLVTLTNPKYADRLLEDNTVDYLFKKLMQMDGKCMISVLLFFRNVINHKVCLDRVVEIKMSEQIFEHLKELVEKDSTSSPKNESIVLLGLDIIKYVVSNSEESAQNFAKILQNICGAFSDAQKDSSFFMEQVFFPIMFTIKTLKTSFYKKTQPKPTGTEEDLSANTDPSSSFKLKSEAIPAESIPTLLSNLDNLVDDSTKEKFKNGKWDCIANTNSTSGSDLCQTIEDQLLGQGPFMILIDGEANSLEYVLGIFCSTGIPKDPKLTAGQRDISVPNNDNHFIFLYEKANKQNTCHYRTKGTSEGEIFLKYTDKSDSSDKGLLIYYMNTEKIFLSFADANNNHIDLYPMKCLETDPQPNFEFPFDFHIKRGIEIWKLSQPELEGNQKDGKGASVFSLGPLDLKNEIFNITYSYFRTSTVYNLPNTITLENVKKVLFNDEQLPIQYLSTHEPVDDKKTIDEIRTENKPIDKLDITDLEYTKESEPKDATLDDFKDLYTPQTPILEEFIANKGIDFILNNCLAVLKSSSNWSDKNAASNWEQIIKEIQYFTRINFIPYFAKNFSSIQILLKLMSNSKLAEKVWQGHEEAMVANIYAAVGKLFRENKSVELRNLSISEGIFEAILERLATVTKETKRKYVEKEEEKVIEEKKTDKDKKEESKTIKRKGVGYEGVTTTNWSTDEFFKLAEAKNKKIKSLLNIVLNILESPHWNAPQEILTIVSESCLLPLIENALRCTSLLDIAKDKDLYELYLNICKAISKIDVLVPSLLPLDKKYKPSQISSIEKLLSQLSNSSSTFKQLSTAASKDGKTVEDNTKTAFGMADLIIEADEVVKTAISKSDAYKDKLLHDSEAILALPMEEKYKTLLENSRFGYVDMKDPKDGAKYIHYWKTNFSGKYSPQPTKMVRLAQEVADISNSLPVDSTNAMFVRADEERLDVMKAIIFGAEGCPYAHGAFEYHIYFVNEYPNGPPKVNLETTGNGDVRFNPNLYSCGKVCLSLLGTWRGNASESWDPKFSTLSQVLVSIQAVVMSEEVYFNEPGYGHEAGTEGGELKNEGYSNIVKLCNVKYAMIGQMERPTKGFENVIRTHFVLKKDKILDTVKEWLKQATTKEANYTGLVTDHNQSYCERFKNKSTAYFEELTAAYEKLEKTLNSLEMPPVSELLEAKASSRQVNKKKKETQSLTEGQGNIADIDMTYEENVQLKSMETDVEGVKDRWSRYIGVMGMESVTKQANASIFISGLNSLGVEVAKNIVLSGAKRVTLHDSKTTAWKDLSGQFFLSESDIGKNRAAACINKIQQLNFYVKVDLSDTSNTQLPDTEEELEKFDFKNYEVIVLIDARQKAIEAISKIARKHNRCLIVADCHGVFSRVFCDFGPKFTCFDKNGEEAQEVMISDIQIAENAKVTLLEGVKHTFEDGDTIQIRGVEGMNLLEGKTIDVPEGVEKPTSINGCMFKVKVINFNTFTIGDTTMFGKYIRGGLAKQIKIPFEIAFKPFHEIYSTEKPAYDSNLEFHDFMKIDNPRILHLAFLALEDFYQTKNRTPASYSIEDYKEFYQIAMKKLEGLPEFIDQKEKEKVLKKVLSRFCMTLEGNLGPQSAFIGGIVCQEIVKAITGKFKPIVQTFYADSMEVLQDDLFPENLLEMESKDYEALTTKENVNKAVEDRDQGIRTLVGQTLFDKMKFAHLFMVGSGAIGCELLKNYAMIGLSTGKPTTSRPKGGQIILTDPDVIEVSNLNRQFLFREKHLRKPKSVTAAAAAQHMNPELKGRLIARLDKVHEGSANIFTDQFFEELTIVTNALDNIQARRYIDARCVAARTPLIESGTLGPKGHVQVIIPNSTESYSSMKDPAEELSIPHCTLKMFPEETLHCVEWARDLFGSLFTQGPQALRKCLEEKAGGNLDGQDFKALKDSAKLASEAPSNFEDCVLFARKLFQQYFHNDIKQLLYVYPLDFKDKDGNPFWKLPKRPPAPLDFDPKNQLHSEFLISFACLHAKNFSIPLPEGIRDDKVKTEIAEKAAKIEIPAFVPSDEKAKEIASDVEKTKQKQETEDMGEAENKKADAGPEDETIDSVKAKFTEATKTMTSEKIMPEEFEKDDDKNYHIDAIYSMANLRADNYKLEEMDWITVKIKAGRIVPALATTTASIAGLQTIEVIKVIKEIKLEDVKNAFLNLAIPILTQSEPAAPPKIKLTEDLTVTLWDRWDIKDCAEKTLQDVFDIIEKEYKLYPRDVIQGAKSLYMRALGAGDKVLKEKLGEMFGASKGEHEDLTITCSLDEKDKKVIQGVPTVRLYF